MSRLKPGATYIYERAMGVIYARESGADPSTRFVIGYESGAEHDPITGHRIQKDLWNDIFKLSETNSTLRDALEQVLIVYNLVKVNE